MSACELDQIGSRQQRADAQHQDALAGEKHRPADVLEDGRRRAFDRDVGVARQFIEIDEGTGNAFAFKPLPGRGPPAGGRAGEFKAIDPLGQTSRKAAANGP